LLFVENGGTDIFFGRSYRLFKDSMSSYLNLLNHAFQQVDSDSVERLVASLNSARSRGSQVFLFGNGGSAANANHWANDLIYGAGKKGRGGVRAHSLAANISVITCLANDTGYENIFSTQLRVLASPGDIAIALSGSGNSPNILCALEECKKLGVASWALVGFDGGQALKLADNVLHFPVDDMQVAEDLQMVVCHQVTQSLLEPLK